LHHSPLARTLNAVQRLRWLWPQLSGGDLDLQTVAGSLLNLFVYEFEMVLESQDLCSELGSDAGDDQLGEQGNALTAVFINLDPVTGSRVGERSPTCSSVTAEIASAMASTNAS
jgi:hypothetical protein